MTPEIQAKLVIFLTTAMKIVGGVLAMHGVTHFAGVPVDQQSLLFYVEPLSGLIVAAVGLYMSIRQRTNATNQAIATTRVAVAQAIGAPLAEVADTVHSSAAETVAILDRNAGVPPHSP